MLDGQQKDSTLDSLRRKKKKRKKKHRDIFDLPGVRKIVLSPLVQKIIGCVVGIHVTGEKPWIYVKKEGVIDNLELHEDSSEFLPIRKEILEYPGQEFLIGYIPSESRNCDEFYVCVTQEATNAVNEIIQKLRAEQEKRLYNTINKSVKEWVSQGTEVEVDEAISKNNRPLLEVEIESQYPIYPTKVKFDTVKAEERRDGYMQLKCEEGTFHNVFRKKIDAYVQVAPRYVTTEAQTICTYPSNMATQYIYEVTNTEEIFEKYKQHIGVYSSENYSNISDFLLVNGALNLYTDDYNSLIGDSKYTKTVAVEEVKEHLSFMDVDLCKGKMISDACWHPMWTGTVAVSYVDAAPSIYKSGANVNDHVFKAVHGLNPVLIWCSNDTLKPKLILESPRPVMTVSFCKFDENILVGGCLNGQIIIWDIRNKLKKVETLEILTPAQQRYRNYLYSLMGWMKNIYDLSLIRPTVVSDLRYSHKGPITAITWMSPFYEFSKSGNLTELPDDMGHSLQFLTSSEDGTISVWDLLKKPTIQPGGFKQRKLRRLKSRPTALMADVSPYKVLHLNLKPMFKIKIRDQQDQKQLVPISSLYACYCNLTYLEVISNRISVRSTICESGYCRVTLVDEALVRAKPSITDRIIYKPIFKKSDQKPVEPKVHLGSIKGDYIHLKWEGLDFDSGEIVNSVDGQIMSMAKYHDGPVNTVDCSEIEDFTLTIGGKVFALWHKDLPNRPILWRKCKHLYTTAEWNIFEPYSFSNKVVNGDVETWVICVNSKAPLYTLTYSSSFLTTSAIHPLNVKKNIYGAGDKQGTFRLYFFSADATHDTSENKIEKCRQFISDAVNRKLDFLSWQENWKKHNATLIKLREEELKILTDKEREAQTRRAAEQAEEKSPDKVDRKGPQPGKYVEWVKEQRQLQEEIRIRSTVISKKQLDTKELERRRKPLQKLDEENERKKRKQKQRLKEGDIIFKDTVASLFPEVVREKPPPPPDPYAAGDNMDKHETLYYEYKEFAKEAEEFVKTHPFEYRFNWKKVLNHGKLRRKLLNDINPIPRKNRATIQASKIRIIEESLIQKHNENIT